MHARAGLILILATVLVVPLGARADHMDGDPATASFSPVQFIGLNPSLPYYGYSSSLMVDVHEQDHSVPTKSYEMQIPSGWNIAMNSVDPSTKDCKSLTGPSDAERVGGATITLHNDDTRKKSGPISMRGLLWFLNHDTATQTTRLCGIVSTFSTLIQEHEVRFDVSLKLNGDGSFTMTWSYLPVAGAAPGWRSIFDNAYFNSKNTSVLFSRIELDTLSYGNYNKDGSGKLAKVRFVWNPEQKASYAFVGTYTPCRVGDPGNCASTAATVVRTTVVQITDYPKGYHPGAVLTAPALWSVLRGMDALAVKWKPPTASAKDAIKGYALTLSADYVPNSTHVEYVVTNPSDAGYDGARDPCAPDGSASECTLALSWPLHNEDGETVPVDANFTVTLVTLFADGHRSDGNCDDGTGPGKPPPCADGTVPAYTATGTARTQFMHRAYAWPLAYRKIIPNSSPLAWPGAWQVYVLLADLDNHKAQYVEWKPTGVTYVAGGTTISGTNAAGGVVSFAQMSGPTHWMLHAVLGPTDARGVWLRMSSTNQVQNADRFDGCSFFGTTIPYFGGFFPDLRGLGSLPCPSTASAMSKI